LRVTAARLGIASRLYLPGYVSDPTLVALYQSTALFVFPSLYEGYGLPVAEAMACGAPVVSAGTSALAELTHPLGQFDPTDPGAIAGAMAAALSDPEVAGALAKASDRPPPTWARTVAAAVAVYEHLGRVEAAREGYDRMVYAVGNSEFHTGALGRALRRPGVVLAHEVRLPQLYAFAAHHGVVDGFGEAVRRMYPGESPNGFPALI